MEPVACNDAQPSTGQWPVPQLLTPAILIDAQVVRENLGRMAEYTRQNRLKLRPHTKTHKSLRLARMQMELGAAGLTVAKAGEAAVMAQASDDLFMAYSPADAVRCRELADLATSRTIRVGVDSTAAIEHLSAAALAAGSTIGILVDIDIGHHRTGVQSPPEALELARRVDRSANLRLDGIMFFPGHLSHGPPAANEAPLQAIDAMLGEMVELWKRHGLEAKIISGGSTPTAFQSHLLSNLTEIRPGTYIFNDMNCVYSGCARLDQCAARIATTVVSVAVPGQVVLDAGSKTLTSDRCGPRPDSGHGYIVQYPQARIVKLSEEHAQVDISSCDRAPSLGERVHVIPNHICPCINLQDRVWWQEPGQPPVALDVDARGKVV